LVSTVIVRFLMKMLSSCVVSAGDKQWSRIKMDDAHPGLFAQNSFRTC
jgi:hypothetical protein